MPYQAQVKSALFTTAAVLAVLWVLRKAPVVSPITRPIVDKVFA